jgi:hypothetical protein
MKFNVFDALAPESEILALSVPRAAFLCNQMAIPIPWDHHFTVHMLFLVASYPTQTLLHHS